MTYPVSLSLPWFYIIYMSLNYNRFYVFDSLVYDFVLCFPSLTFWDCLASAQQTVVVCFMQIKQLLPLLKIFCHSKPAVHTLSLIRHDSVWIQAPFILLQFPNNSKILPGIQETVLAWGTSDRQGMGLLNSLKSELRHHHTYPAQDIAVSRRTFLILQH